MGTARNALYNLLFARQHGGAFVLRIDDTDPIRSTRESEAGVLEGLRWLGLEWDEGPDVGGDLGPYRPTERIDLYHHYAQALLDNGRGYYCFCTPEELEQERQAALAVGELPRYSGRCWGLGASQVQAKVRAGLEPVVRLRIDPKAMDYVDLVEGRIEQDAALIGDPVILRADRTPLYSFATVVDDHTMQISHVLRSAEHINNTFPQLQMYEALGFEPPAFGHLGLLLNPDRSKISKRAGAVYIGEFRDLGYLPEAMINHLALSGWNPGTEQEIFSFQELLEAFSLERCGQSNAIFDRQKLLWLNGTYIRNLAVPELARRTLPFLIKAGLWTQDGADAGELKRLEGIMALEQERLKTLAEAPEMLAFFYRDPDPTHSIELLKSNKFARRHTLVEIGAALRGSLQALEEIDDTQWSAEALSSALDGQAQRLGWKRGELLMPIRIVVSGREATPSLFETLEYVGRSATLRRINALISSLEHSGGSKV